MTQWRTPGQPPRPPDAPSAEGAPDARGVASARPAERARPGAGLRSQWVVLGIAGAFIVAAIVLLVVVLAGGDDSPAGPRPGSADVVTDKLAAAVHAGSAGQVRAVTCIGAKQRVLVASRPLFGTAPTRQGVAKVQGAVAVGRLTLAGSAQTATVGLRRGGTQWCVASLVTGG